ncbi:uncharacterized protein Z518_04570 [Rhinocladiella mackenziei CBS 650.93]|uniref:N-acetyltransferase domain-containing protein n=1 Tax=Rhinocladiella mackenziei CBS 650.93 TaxID=1442369 RepID=A0A0D2ILI8_9EURO|nr:uncharacterized protein Z518_04570 [Rhinocladiella mackenziei CBS 650.93]KIX06594.1 hypothetical protein Z518_04570 [Rhinocladiella mackenziei CBS 650.93]
MHIRPVQRKDLSEVATVARDAMFDDELTLFLAPYRHEHPECLRQGFLRRAKHRYYSGHVLLAAVSDEKDSWWDGTEKILGHVSVISSKQNTESSKKPWFSWNALELRLLRVEELFLWLSHGDKSISRANMAEFARTTGDRGPLADIKDYWDVDHLSVDPSFQRRGIGSALIEQVKDIAALDNLPVVLVASVKGIPMYKKAGFVDHGLINTGAGQLGQAMAWYPNDATT